MENIQNIITTQFNTINNWEDLKNALIKLIKKVNLKSIEEISLKIQDRIYKYKSEVNKLNQEVNKLWKEKFLLIEQKGLNFNTSIIEEKIKQKETDIKAYERRIKRNEEDLQRILSLKDELDIINVNFSFKWKKIEVDLSMSKIWTKSIFNDSLWVFKNNFYIEFWENPRNTRTYNQINKLKNNIFEEFNNWDKEIKIENNNLDDKNIYNNNFSNNINKLVIEEKSNLVNTINNNNNNNDNIKTNEINDEDIKRKDKNQPEEDINNSIEKLKKDIKSSKIEEDKLIDKILSKLIDLIK